MQTQCTPIRRGLCVPAGHLAVHPKWKDSILIGEVKNKIQVLFLGEIGVSDFHPSSNICVIYITENDIVSGKQNKQRIAKLRNALSFQQRYVIVDKTPLTDEAFIELQEFVVLECQMCILPVESISDTADFLVKLVKMAMKTPAKSQTKRRISHMGNSDSNLLIIIQKFPKIGETRAKLLLQKFGSLKRISEASISQLSVVIGQTAAKNLHEFLN